MTDFTRDEVDKTITREEWLTYAMQLLSEHFQTCGYTVPKNVRVSCGLPSGRAFSAKRAIGEAWCSKASKDEHFEIFVSPTIDEEQQVLATLAHEMVHVVVGLKAGHKGMFGICAAKIGLMGPWTATKPNEAFKNRLTTFRTILGEYPHSSLSKMTNGKKKQTTRLIRCSCEGCCYTVRLAMKWILVGVPQCANEECPDYQSPMTVDIPEEDQDLIGV